MRDFLAEKLLVSVMDWKPEDIAQERPYLQAMAAYKYDSYGQFRPGMRFIESLALWLGQISLLEERQLLYSWLKSKLVFISDAEMAQLVSLSFPQIVRPKLISRCADQLALANTQIARIVRTPEYTALLRQTLFLGLSDGAELALFRRFNPEISHEQVWLTYDITEDKAGDMLGELRADLAAVCPHGEALATACFREIVLIDDFSASGLSYIRTEKGVYKGKIPKALGMLARHKELVTDDFGISVILYVATERAVDHLRRTLVSYPLSRSEAEVHVIQTIDERQQVGDDDEVIPLLKKYFDSQIVDRHFRKGRHARPYLGFDECALPLVLSHNTPNNSVPLLWFHERCSIRGLFPRVTRHKA